MKLQRLLVSTLVVFLAAIIAINVTANSSPILPLPAANAANLTCQQILARAIEVLQNSCSQIGRNKACYGNDNVKAVPNGAAILNFSKAGDITAIDTLRSIETSPLNISSGTWGLSLLKLQANLPDSLPGKNVTFLVYGDTHIDNTSGNMQSFYFSSGLGTPECKETPHNGIVVKSPNHTQVTFTANGVEITIASTIQLEAQLNKTMTVALIEGHATVATSAGSQTLLPGQTVSIPLAGSNGLSAAGAPSKPVALSNDTLRNTLVRVAEQVSTTVEVSIIPGGQTAGTATPAATVNTTSEPDDPKALVITGINGVITAVHGNMITVNGYTINVGSNKALKNAKVGDYVQINGEFKLHGSKQIDIETPSIVPQVPVKGVVNQSVVTAQGSTTVGSATDSQQSTGNGNSNGNGNGKNKDKDKDKDKDKNKNK